MNVLRAGSTGLVLGHGEITPSTGRQIYHLLKAGELYRPPILHPDTERSKRERATKCLPAELECPELPVARSLSAHKPAAVKRERGCEQVEVTVTVKDADAGLLRSGGDQQVAQRHAVLAALGQLAHRG